MKNNTILNAIETINSAFNNIMDVDLGVVVMNYQNIPAVFASIISGAFNPSAVTGGVVGSMFLSMKKGGPEVFSPTKPVSAPVPSLMPVRN